MTVATMDSPTNVNDARRQCAQLRALLLPPGMPSTDESARVAALLDNLALALGTPVDDYGSDFTSSDDEGTPEPEIKHKQTAYKNDTEIAISRIFALGKTEAVDNPSINPRDPYDGPSVITMTSFGELGRWGNQLLQYMFLKSYAECHNIDEIQTPGWVGASLFGLDDATVNRRLPPVSEFRDTVANSTFTTALLDQVLGSDPGHNVPQFTPEVLTPNAKPIQNVDVWGWFQWHTSAYAPFRSAIQKTLEPVPELRNHLSKQFDQNVRNRGGVRRTVVALHLRLGDYKTIAASSFGYVAPTSWYLSWLEKIWPTLDNPILFVASDDVDTVLRDFAAYEPLTCTSAGLTVPSSMQELKAGFFPDWYALTQADVAAISNSTFSFTACMMNQIPGARFFRAHYSGKMTEISPWAADPIVHRDMNKDVISKTVDTLKIIYQTQGAVAIARNVLYELPYYGMRSVMMKAVLACRMNKEVHV